MKIFNIEIPNDLEIPELDQKTINELDALRAKSLAYEAELEKARLAEEAAGGHVMTDEEAWRHMNPHANGPRPAPTINLEVFRQFTPRLRAIFVYINRDEVSY